MFFFFKKCFKSVHGLATNLTQHIHIDGRTNSLIQLINKALKKPQVYTWMSVKESWLMHLFDKYLPHLTLEQMTCGQSHEVVFVSCDYSYFSQTMPTWFIHLRCSWKQKPLHYYELMWHRHTFDFSVLQKTTNILHCSATTRDGVTVSSRLSLTNGVYNFAFTGAFQSVHLSPTFLKQCGLYSCGASVLFC